MRTTWNGSISFVLVSIPVGLAPATKPAARASDVSFRMLHRECGTPIKQKRFCPVHERDLGPDEIVKGWEVAKGQFVIVEDEEIEALTNRDDSRSIEISRFVDAAEVDPIFFDRTYFLVPAQAPAARRPYVLLLNAMNESGMAALGRFVQQGREKLCLIRPKGDALALETLFLAADVYVFACGPWLGTVFPGVMGDLIRPTRQEVFFFGTPEGDPRFSESALPVWIDRWCAKEEGCRG